MELISQKNDTKGKKMFVLFVMCVMSALCYEIHDVQNSLQD